MPGSPCIRQTGRPGDRLTLQEQDAVAADLGLRGRRRTHGGRLRRRPHHRLGRRRDLGPGDDRARTGLGGSTSVPVGPGLAIRGWPPAPDRRGRPGPRSRTRPPGGRGRRPPRCPPRSQHPRSLRRRHAAVPRPLAGGGPRGVRRPAADRSSGAGRARGARPARPDDADPARVGTEPQPAPAQRLPPVHRRSAPVGDGRSRPRELADRVDRPDLLVLGALLHDIGKGYPGRPQRGRRRAGRRHRPAAWACRPTTSTPSACWCATTSSCPTSPPDGIWVTTPPCATWPTGSGSTATLELLGALTEADSIATGSSAWGPWKAELVTKLVERTARLHRRGRRGRRRLPVGRAAGPDGRAASGSSRVRATR